VATDSDRPPPPGTPIPSADISTPAAAGGEPTGAAEPRVSASPINSPPGAATDSRPLGVDGGRLTGAARRWDLWVGGAAISSLSTSLPLAPPPPVAGPPRPPRTESWLAGSVVDRPNPRVRVGDSARSSRGSKPPRAPPVCSAYATPPSAGSRPADCPARISIGAGRPLVPPLASDTAVPPLVPPPREGVPKFCVLVNMSRTRRRFSGPSSRIATSLVSSATAAASVRC